jgi:hypothetical protein
VPTSQCRLYYIAPIVRSFDGAIGERAADAVRDTASAKRDRRSAARLICNNDNDNAHARRYDTTLATKAYTGTYTTHPSVTITSDAGNQ